MSDDVYKKPIEDLGPAPAGAGDEPDADDVEGHALGIDPTTARMLQRAREDDIVRQAEKHRREKDAKDPFRPKSRP